MFLLRLAHARLKGRAQGAGHGHGHKGVKLAHRIGEGCRCHVAANANIHNHTQMRWGAEKENRNIKKQILKVQWAIFSVQHPQEGVHDGVTLSSLPAFLPW